MSIYILEPNEYLFLHAAFQSQFVWGIGPDFANEAAEQAAMEAAFAALQEKGLVSVQQEQLYVKPELWALMRACTDPHQVLMTLYTDTQEAQEIHFVYWGEDSLVEDCLLPSQSRQLQIVENTLDLAMKIKAQLHLAEQTQTVGEPHTLPAATMEAIQRLASQDKEKVMGTLLEAGVDATSAASITQAYVAPIANAVFTRIIPGEDSAATGMILIAAEGGLWEIHEVDETQIHLTSMDAEMAWQAIAAFCGVEMNATE